MKNFFIKLSTQISMLALLFCVVIASFILVDFLRFNAVQDPAESALEALKSQIVESPQNADLKEVFAELELIYRRAYFTTDTQISKGASLLLLAFGTFLISFALRAYLSKMLPALPEKDSLKKEEKAEDLFIKILFGTILIGVIFSVVVLLKELLNGYKSPAENTVLAYSSQEELDANWTALRSSKNDGIAKNLSFADNPKISKFWESALDIEGFNSVVQFGEILYISGLRGDDRIVSAFDLNSGSKLWESSLTKQVELVYDEQTGKAPSTMACDAYRAYAIFTSGELVAYTKEGKLAWQKQFPLPEINYGYASSILVSEKSLIVQMSLDETNIVYAVDAATGADLWQYNNENVSASWSSPTLVEFENKKILIILSSVQVFALDISTGEVLWENDCMGGEVAPSASYLDGKVFVANENVAAFAFDVLTGEILWENSSIVLPSISSLTVDKNAVYLYSTGATITRLNTATGEVISEMDVDEGFNSSPLSVGDKVLACDLSGKIFITKTNSDIGESFYDVGEPINATPALVGDKIILRLENKILCLKVEGQ